MDSSYVHVAALSPIEVGRLGEDLCSSHLESLGLTIVERNWHTPFGEVDIIAQDGDETVFVEVKTRLALGESDTRPEVRFDDEKRDRYRRLIVSWCATHPGSATPRLDVAGIKLVADGKAQLRYYTDVLVGDL